jgi:ATP/maltotriose-dependent transcriptional regulator MalT
MLKNDLLANKLHVPQLRTKLVPRPHVVDLLEQGTQRALTLISAPAGSGKTTLLSSWLHDAEVMASWLSLDSHDNDLHRFWAYVLAALDMLYPGTFKDAQETLKAMRLRQSLPIEDVLTILVNDLVDLEDEVMLILDDYHEIITPAIHTSLAFLLDHLPAQVHLFIVGRSDPPFSLARLRTNNQLVEIRTDDLQFSLSEATLFFNDVMGLHLTTEEIAALAPMWLAYLGIAELYREWNRLHQAESSALQVLKLGDEWSSRRAFIDSSVVLAMIKHAQGHTDQGLALLRREEMIAHREQSLDTVNVMRAYQALLEVQRENAQAALPWLQDFKQQMASYPLTTRSEQEYRILARVQLACGKYAEAEEVLSRLLALAEREGRMRAVIKAMVLQALVFQVQGAMERATDKIIQALTLAESEGYVLSFTEEGAQMTRLLNRVFTAQRAGTIVSRTTPEYLALLLEAGADDKTLSNDLLSERELEILRLISFGLSNQEIANQLVIAMSTVKWHVRQIFNKLGVNSRTQVLLRARELSLL